jgi:uncharacterized protein
LRDIVKELEKPGRDPRAEFRYAEFLEGVSEIRDVKPGMWLEGVVTNVTNFGAFVDVGVHQDGLVHISQLANRFVSNPLEVVNVGQVVKVRVVEVNEALKRISLSMKAEQAAGGSKSSSEKKRQETRNNEHRNNSTRTNPRTSEEQLEEQLAQLKAKFAKS